MLGIKQLMPPKLESFRSVRFKNSNKWHRRLGIVSLCLILLCLCLVDPPAQNRQPEKAAARSARLPGSFALPLPAVSPALSPSLLKPASTAQLHQAVQDAIAQSYRDIPDQAGENRFKLSQRLQHLLMRLLSQQGWHQGPLYTGAELVILAFEGTAEFEPRMAPVMLTAARSLREQGLSTLGSPQTLQYAVFQGIKQASGQAPNWSGLLTGPLESLLQTPDLSSKIQWLSFPSEEFEAFSRLTPLNRIPLTQLGELAFTSPRTPGIEAALRALIEIHVESQQMGKQPRFVILAHSSGARSAIKFLEQAAQINNKGKNLRFPLMLTIDPLSEADQLLGEAFRLVAQHEFERIGYRLTGWLNLLPLIDISQAPVGPPILAQGPQPDKLYKPANVDSLINFYQQQDTQGLRMQPHFGIHGGLVQGALNYEVQQLGNSGHSEISYHPLVTRTFIEQLRQLVNQAGS